MSEQLDLFGSASAPPDAGDRELVTGQLDATLFVEAGAGSGKTEALVSRIVNLVRAGTPIGEIAAITFTEKAASELRHRIRLRLETAAVGDAQADQRVLAKVALTDLDMAPVGTLHAFARRVLNEFPIEAQLPPRFAVLDEVQSATAFHERFSDFLEALLDDPQSVRLVELCQHDNFGIENGGRRMADDFQSNWDLVEDRVSPNLPLRFDAATAQRQLADACATIAGFTPPEGDTQEKVRLEYASIGEQLGAQLPFGELLRLFREAADVKYAGKGTAEKWKRHHGSAEVLPAYRAAVATAIKIAEDALVQCNEERRLTLGVLLREFTLQSVRDRERAGELEFHDLLVLARRLVANNSEVRRQLHRRYTHLLLDEFQDTDPIQLELAVRITADPEQQPDDWRLLHPLPGRLTVVGDPKQSIYRFRRADISQFLRACDQIGAQRATLRANFRSASPIIDWVNTTMGQLLRFEPDVQPAYEPLIAARHGGHNHGSVTVLGEQPHTDLGRAAAEDLREREAADVAAIVVQALSDQWQVWRDGELHPCRPGDIAILLPSRLSLTALQAALAANNVPFRAENSSLVYAAAEVRALMLALRAADDPTDELAIVSALRTPLFGCSDRHLYEWKVTHNQGWGWRHIPADLDHPVATGLRALGELSERVPYDTPSQLLSWLVRERCVLELALAGRDHRDVWRRVRFVIDQARAWSEAGGHGVRRYLLWTRLQGDEGRFVAETVLPETDHDAVRIMTVHAAKGLQFPITVLSGLSSRGSANRGRRVVWPEGTWTLSEPDDPTYQQFQPIDEQMGDAERLRLLYVACTRAMDHLVVSLHRGEKPDRSAAWSIAQAAEGAGHRQFAGHHHVLMVPPANPTELPWADEQQWWQTWQDDLARAGRPAAMSATALASAAADGAARERARADDGLRKDPVDLDLPPWQRGRYGTAVGRAVHAVLQFANLRTGDNIAALAAAQAAAEGVPDHERTIERLARSTLSAPIVAEGIEFEHWRELFVAADVGGTIVEGYIDLLVRHPHDGLVIVDYKTDQIPEGGERSERLARYGTQLAAYGLALQQVLGEPVAAGMLVMCRLDGPAQQVAIDDWAARSAALRLSLVAVD
ncbi:MAG: UvrD-helicase domain-containing protein [Actinobacteria bacterium]|nr:UvrD-helicase domain-containing protein [Actinomycetota bacterium]